MPQKPNYFYMFTRDEILKDENVKEFLRTSWRKESTKKEYITRIRHYSNFTGKTPTQLIDEAEKEQDAGIKRRKRQIKKYIFDFIDYLKDDNKSVSTIKNYVETIKGFYNSFDIDPPSTRGVFPTESNNPIFEQLPTREQLKKALNIAGVRDKSILLLQFSTGMGSAEIRSLTYHHFLDAIKEDVTFTESEQFNVFKLAQLASEKDILIGTWDITRIKTGMHYITFTTTEATKSIIDYLIYRTRMNKPVETLDSPLFINQYNKTLTAFNFTKLYKALNQRAGLGKRSPKRNSLTSHMLRKLFATTCYEEEIDQLKVDWMLGHKINDVSAAYFKAKPERLKKEYMKIESKLTLAEVEIKDIAPEQIKDIVHELDMQKQENKELKKMIVEIKQDMENIKGDSSVEGEFDETIEKD